MQKQFDFITVLSFITGRLYCNIDCIYDISSFLAQHSVQTIELPLIMTTFKDEVLSQLSESQQEICNNWEHTYDWPKKVAEFKDEVVILTN